MRHYGTTMRSSDMRSSARSLSAMTCRRHEQKSTCDSKDERTGLFGMALGVGPLRQLTRR